MAPHNDIGRIGEEIACKYLQRKGYTVIDRNYRKPWGEIDIVVKIYSIIHFIEVKTVSRENISIVPRENSADGEYRAEDNIHPQKVARLKKIIQTYLLDKSNEDNEWVFDVITVHLDTKNKRARVHLLSEVVL